VHSFVDVITNSSTTIYTYQSGCIDAAKAVVNEMLALEGSSLKADDVFYFGAFCDDDVYLDKYNYDSESLPAGIPVVTGDWDSPEHDTTQALQTEWFNNLKLSIMKGEAERPDWFELAEECDEDYNPDMNLEIIPKDEKYKVFGEKLLKFLNSSDHEAS
jgi:hypothetical protein